MVRTGIGYDIHRLVEGRLLFIGGVEIPYIKGLEGHSDGDVLLHAVCDALLGAVCAGDIGELFPDTDPQFHNVTSDRPLAKVLAVVREKKFRICNIDTVVIAQEPVLAPFKKEIRKRIAAILELDEESVSVKAKTNEGLGDVGRKEAIVSFAVAAIERE